MNTQTAESLLARIDKNHFHRSTNSSEQERGWQEGPGDGGRHITEGGWDGG